ncbi:MAG: dihydrofolate reductase family protein [Faecalicoccus sp.]|nr:dihydrofolate reductase family protein [Faecalicoccus sp.]
MFIVCHILTSLDGKISGDFFGSSSAMKAAGTYGQLRNHYDVDATLYGTTTMGEFIGTQDSILDTPFDHEDHIIKDDSYVVAIDMQAKLHYTSGKFTRRGKTSQIIAVVSRQVSKKRLGQLRNLGVAYIVAGQKKLDASLAVKKLETLFGIQKMMIAGGGYIDWAFLKEDFIDELSIVMAPSVDGFKDTPSLFMKSEDDGIVKDFELMNVEIAAENTMWLRYKVKK